MKLSFIKMLTKNYFLRKKWIFHFNRIRDWKQIRAVQRELWCRWLLLAATEKRFSGECCPFKSLSHTLSHRHTVYVQRNCKFSKPSKSFMGVSKPWFFLLWWIQYINNRRGHYSGISNLKWWKSYTLRLQWNEKTRRRVLGKGRCAEYSISPK